MSLKKINSEIKNLQTLLELEKKEDLAQFHQRLAEKSFKELRNNGVLWYPVTVEKTEYDTGERLLVKVVRNKEHKHSHLFQSGKLVSIIRNISGTSSDEDFVTGVVNQVSEQEMIITLNTDYFPNWFDTAKIGVQLLFDENSYKQMELTLKYLIETDEKRINELKEIILGSAEAQFEHKYLINTPKLNESQNKALNKISAAKDIAIVHGPPGTGKTTTLVYSVLHTLKTEKQVLVCAPSNAAVDLLVDKLSEQGAEVVRIGHPARVTENSLSHTLDYRITQHPDYVNLKKIKKDIEQSFRQASKYVRNYDKEHRMQRKEMYDKAYELKKEAKHLSFYITNNILENAQVIATTLVGANNQVLKGRRFRTVFIDEAAQGLEPATWIPITKAERVIFAGDHNQLPPTIKSVEAAKQGLEQTLFEKAIKRNNADIMLEEQYRMNELIMNFSNEYFYDGKLFANEAVAHHTVFDGDKAVEFIDLAGLGYVEQTDSETLSHYNIEEARLLFKHLTNYLYQVEQNKAFDNLKNLAIISPYSAQIIRMQELYEKETILPEEYKEKISINTIDSFQGQERDVIYISLVRSNEKANIGFLSDIRRMNVAITRARKKLVVFGDSGTIGNHDFYKKFLDYIIEIDAYKSAYELLYL